MRSGFAICLMFAYLAQSASAQNGEWVTNGNYEYYFGIQYDELFAQWHTARAWCMDNGGDLANTYDGTERAYIVQILNANSFYATYVWIGLNKYFDRNTWTWIDGTVTNGNNLLWEDTYPQEDFEHYVHLCVDMNPNDPEGKYRNNNCGDERGFVCRRDLGDTAPNTIKPTVSVGGYCPSGYYGNSNSNKCFKVVFRTPETGLSWLDAVTECRNAEGILPDIASFTDAAENAIVTAQLQTYHWGVWIGFYRSDIWSTDWKWIDNSPSFFVNWAIGQPSSAGECAEIWSTPGSVGHWNVINCADKRGFVCQTFKDSSNIVPTPNPTPTPNTCDSGYIPYFYGCYKVVTEAASWTDANTDCTNDGGHLVSIHYQAENAAIFTKVAEAGQTMWLGFRDFANDGLYTWSDHWAVVYTKWGPNQPQQEEGGGCVAMQTDGFWYDSICTARFGYICKKTDASPLTTPAPLEGFCPGEDDGDSTQWIEYQNYCYFFETSDTDNWLGALTKCSLMGPLSSLVSIHNPQENDFILNKMTENSNAYSHTWTGMFRTNNDTHPHFLWTDLSALQYTNWALGEPNGEVAGEDCVEQYSSGQPALWNDAFCTNWNHYACKSPKLPPIPDPPLADGTCKDDFVPWGDNCYYFQANVLVNWNEAKETCEGLGASLPSIEGPRENRFIKESMFNLTHLPAGVHYNYWIGLLKDGPLKEDNEFYWMDTSKAIYRFWANGEPNDLNDREHCVESYPDNARWNDIFCDENVMKAFVCKMPIDTGGGLSGGAIAGIVIGVLVAVVLITGIILYLTGFNAEKARNVLSRSNGGLPSQNYDKDFPNEAA